ncbi:DUF4268 domain-containing protein [Sinorhizobium medicae]|nr:DUF4268 domain-containing protein [Sinorhizobium medicae]MDX0617567.1 DUF4268 domain-containing protein [Sinorhizobium medicae]MDX0654706.1 DUF4268 domain-containing protein [Sinorhizobium medicae]MDX1090914.1 DUF4268 domain-containing protein [Sinorhizobium medicae]MDX1115560.1 DUF4268 domain-containing protein [Sinorhizobium medicae]
MFRKGNTLTIGRLVQVPLREVWKHEAYDFTQWLQENIEVVNDALGLNLINIEREQTAGPFSIDLVAEDENGNKVIIENQLEKSNHDHLGKLITYLTSMGARTAIWIVSEPRPEHVAAIAWLNENSSGTFYLVKVQALKIGDSAPAPLLTVIVAPAEDKSEVARTNKEFAERYDIRLHWWTMLIKRPDAKLHAHLSPKTYSWIGTSSGFRGLAFNYSVTQKDSTAELYIDRGLSAGDESKRIFYMLQERKEEIERSFGAPLIWEPLDNGTTRASRIKYVVQGGYKSDEIEWDSIQAKLVDAMNRLHATFKEPIKQVRQRLGEVSVEG